MIGVIADDLTGAAEIGALGWRHGLRAEVVRSARSCSDVDLVCVDTDSRSVTPEEARQRVAAAVQSLKQMGPRWIYKKVDSVLRGHVVTELETLLEQLRLDSVLLVPANPNRGRVIRHGQYFVGERPIHETEFSRDPEHPRGSADVLQLLGHSQRYPVQLGSVRAPQVPPGIVVGAAESGADLQGWAAHRSPAVLVAGAAEFFEALLRADGFHSTKMRTDDGSAAAPGGGLFVCGTLSESARAFLQMARQQKTPVFTLPDSVVAKSDMDMPTQSSLIRDAVGKLESHSSVVLATPPLVASDPAVSRKMSEQLARLACGVLQATVVSNVYVEGGATAAHLLRQMGWEQLQVVREIAPGVVTLLETRRSAPFLTIKPGSYVWPDEIQAAARGDLGKRPTRRRVTAGLF